MRFIFFILVIIFSSTSLLAHQDKNGFHWGLGLAATQYKYPIQFTGVTKNKVDDSANLFGPVLSLGHNFQFESFVLGVRAEGMMGDNLSSGSYKGKSKTDKLNGRIRSANLLGHLGWTTEIPLTNPVGHRLNLLGEFFIEAGLTNGHKSFSKEFSLNVSPNESYHESLVEDYTGRVLNFGFNIKTDEKAFFEIKFSQIGMLTNQQSFSGFQTIGGTTTSLNQKYKNNDFTNMYSLMIIIGKQY